MELKKEVKTINVFLTPLASFLIICAVLISNADTISAGIGLFIVLFTIFFNNITATVSSPSGVLVAIRVIVNLILNFILVYIFIPFWTPIWLLLMLSCLATAIYSNLAKTLLISFISAIALVLIFYLRVVPNLVSGYTKLIRVGEIVNYALFIIIISWLTNRMVKQNL